MTSVTRVDVEVLKWKQFYECITFVSTAEKMSPTMIVKINVIEIVNFIVISYNDKRMGNKKREDEFVNNIRKKLAVPAVFEQSRRVVMTAFHRNFLPHFRRLGPLNIVRHPTIFLSSLKCLYGHNRQNDNEN